MKEPLFSEISQVALVVPDLGRAAQVLTEELGVGPLLNLRFGAVEGDPSFAEGGMTLPIDDYYLDGAYIGQYGIFMAAAAFENGVQLEMISPAQNRSLFREYLDRHGPGVQHICIRHGRDYAGYLRLLGEMAVAGNPLASVCKVDKEEICAFVRHDRLLGLAVEVQHRPETYRLPDLAPPMLPANRAAHPRPLAGAMTGMTIAAWNMAQVLELLEEKYGIGPWELGGPGLHGFRSGVYTEIRTAVCRALNLELEIFEPVCPGDENDEAVRFLRRNGGNGVFSVHFTAPEGVDVLKAKRRVLFGNDHAGLLDFTEELGTYLKFTAATHQASNRQV